MAHGVMPCTGSDQGLIPLKGTAGYTFLREGETRCVEVWLSRGLYPSGWQGGGLRATSGIYILRGGEECLLCSLTGVVRIPGNLRSRGRNGQARLPSSRQGQEWVLRWLAAWSLVPVHFQTSVCTGEGIYPISAVAGEGAAQG